MTPQTKKTVGWITSGCGCLLLLALGAWLMFVVYIGLEGRGNDEEISFYIGIATCCVMTPVLILTIVGLVMALRKPPEQP